MSKLKLSYRQVVVLREMQQLSVKETSLVLNWSENKVKMTLSRALKKLEEILLKQGGEKSEQIR
ncbi:RNA polymerase sigma factor [Oceanobacillus sp. FSL H7-0719]|uniref:RNA polymerase sigma factor n=1 Tax=Oceanobacillus sp. FSL H7-0719 TaxID=2954507 RepID=UPI00386A31DA